MNTCSTACEKLAGIPTEDKRRAAQLVLPGGLSESRHQPWVPSSALISSRDLLRVS